MDCDTFLQLFDPLPVDHEARKPGVYVLLEGDTVVYVGQSFDVALRVATHKKDGRCFDHVRWIPFARRDRDLLLRWETIAILLLHPKENSLIALRVTPTSVSELPYAFLTKRRRKT